LDWIVFDRLDCVVFDYIVLVLFRPFQIEHWKFTANQWWIMINRTFKSHANEFIHLLALLAILSDLKYNYKDACTLKKNNIIWITRKLNEKKRKYREPNSIQNKFLEYITIQR
jgi:hypothetical protein